MRRIAWSVVTLLTVGVAPAPAGPGVADLFPPDTLAFAEIREPAKVAPQFAAAVAGSRLADVMKLVDAHRDAARTPHDLVGKPQLAVLGLLAAPEFATEVGKLGGVGVGLTGFNDGGEPEAAVAVLTGDSAAAGLAARAFLSLAAVRRVGAADGVPVYQFRTPRFSYDPNTGQQKLDNDKPPGEGPYEATAAYTPGLFVYGTSKASVAAVLARYRGKGANGLGGVAAFRAARGAHPHPGVFVYADAAALGTRLDEARRVGGGLEPDVLGWVKLLAGENAVRHVAGTVRFRDGGLAAELSASFAPGRPSPLLAVLSGPAVKAEYLAHAPASAGVAGAIALPEKDRAAVVVGFLDAAAKASGGLGRTPSEALKELETRFKTPTADALIGKTHAVTVFTPRVGSADKTPTPPPTVVLQTDSSAAAAAWEDFLPKLAAGLGGGEPARPSSEEIDGVKVLSLPGTDLPWRAGLHYARKGAAVAVGLDRALVAAALTPDPAAKLPGDQPAAFAGFVQVGGVVRGLRNGTRPTGPVVPVNPPRPPRPGFQPGGTGLSAEAHQKAEEKALGAVWAALDSLPPARVTARRDGDTLRVEFVQPVGTDGFAPVINAGVGWFDAALNRNAHLSPGGPGSFPRFR